MDPRPLTLHETAQRLVQRRRVFDAHVDAIGREVDLGHDLSRRGPGHFDLVRAAEGGLSTVVLVAWVDPEQYLDRAAERARTMVAAVHELAARAPDQITVVGNGAELQEAQRLGRIAAIPGIEGGHAIEDSLLKLERFFDQGVRVLTLVWNNHLSWIRSCQPGAGAGVPRGLAVFGREVVRSMNRLGMVVDLSHASERAFYDALDATDAPVIASHSGCKRLHDHPRNLDDHQLRALRNNGGVVGIVFHPGFLDKEAHAEEARVRKLPEYRNPPCSDPAEQFLWRQDLMRQKAQPLRAERLCDHIVHAVDQAGVEHVGLGSDYDGIERGPEGLEDASGYGLLTEKLLNRGFDAFEVEKILGGNMERVFLRVTGDGTRAGEGATQLSGLPV